MKATIIVEMAKDGTFSCYMKEDIEQACMVGFGKTAEECKNDLLSFYHECLDDDSNFPVLEFEWKYDIASFLNYYSVLNTSQLAKVIGVNASLLRRYKSGAKASQKTYDKFALGIHRIGAELLSAKF